MIDQAPPGLDSPMSGFSAPMPIHRTRYVLSIIRFRGIRLADLSPSCKEGGSFRTLFRIGTFMLNLAPIERSISGLHSIRIGMSSGSVPGRVDFRFRSLRRRLSFPFSLSQLRLRPPRRSFPFHLRWHRARTPRCHLPSPRSHVGARARLPSSSESVKRALVCSFRSLAHLRFLVSRRRLPLLGTHVDARA